MYRVRNNICKPYKYTRKKLKANEKKVAEASNEQNIGMWYFHSTYLIHYIHWKI